MKRQKKVIVKRINYNEKFTESIVSTVYTWRQRVSKICYRNTYTRKYRMSQAITYYFFDSEKKISHLQTHLELTQGHHKYTPPTQTHTHTQNQSIPPSYHGITSTKGSNVYILKRKTKLMHIKRDIKAAYSKSCKKYPNQNENLRLHTLIRNI